MRPSQYLGNADGGKPINIIFHKNRPTMPSSPNTTRIMDESESGADDDRSITIPSQSHTCHCDTKTPLLLGPSAFPRGVKFHCEVQNQAAGEM